MPSKVVHGKSEEAAWDRAKAAVKRQYPDIEESNPRFYQLTTTIFANMKAMDEDDAEMHKAIVGLILRPRSTRPLVVVR